MAKYKNESETNINIHIGKKIRKKRIDLNWTQTELANKIKVTFQQVQKYEKGKNSVSSPKLLILSYALNVPITYFFEGFDVIQNQSNFRYEDNPPELNRNNQVRNEKYYPNPNSYSEILDDINSEEEKLKITA